MPVRKCVGKRVWHMSRLAGNSKSVRFCLEKALVADRNFRKKIGTTKNLLTKQLYITDKMNTITQSFKYVIHAIIDDRTQFWTDPIFILYIYQNSFFIYSEHICNTHIFTV